MPKPESTDAAQAPISWRHSLRLWFGLTLMMLGVLALSHRFWLYAAHNPVVLKALLAGSVAALATALGTLAVMRPQGLLGADPDAKGLAYVKT